MIDDRAAEPELVVVAPAGWLGGSRLADALAVGVRGDRIAWIGPPSAAPDCPRIAVRGALLPGLIDHHVHAGLIALPPLLRAGITTVHDLGWRPEESWRLVRQSAGAGFDGPRVLAAGPFLTAVGGYPTAQDWAPPGIAWELAGPAAAVDAVRRIAGHRPLTVKVALNSVAGPTLDGATLAAVVRTAHAAGLPVTAHVEGIGQASRAATAGVDTLAHTPWSERLTPELITHLAGHITIVSTVDIHGWGAASRARDRAVDNLRRFRAAGGRVRYGTDLGNGPLPVSVNPREITALIAAGLTPVEILHAITAAPLVVGIRADLVEVPADPTADPAALTRATPVLTSGVPLGGHARKGHPA